MATTTSLRRLWNRLKPFLKVSLFKLLNAGVIIALSSSLVLYGVLLLFRSTARELLLKELCDNINRVILPQNLFSQPTVGSPAYVAWGGILMLDVGSSRSYLFDPGHHHLHIVFEVIETMLTARHLR